MKTIDQLKNKDLFSKTCLLRIDLNLDTQEIKLIKSKKLYPLRIEKSLPTIKFLLKKNSKIILISHRQRPKEKNGFNFKLTKEEEKKFSLLPIKPILEKELKRKIIFFKNFNFTKIRKEIKKHPPKTIFLLENLRFLKGEKENNVSLAKKMASLADFYVNDAFSVSHRQNASVSKITQFLPSFAGFLLISEVNHLSKLTKKTKKPFLVILGGAKVKDKIGLIKFFFKKANGFLLGGGMANTLFSLSGLPVGDSLIDKNVNPKLINKFISKIFLPLDVVIFNNQILDIGKKTINFYQSLINFAKTIVFNGPLGYIEDKRFQKGTKSILKAILNSSAYVIIGGGETTSLIAKKYFKNPPKNVFISTGGGAMLKFLAGEKLPGLASLKKNKINLD